MRKTLFLTTVYLVGFVAAVMLANYTRLALTQNRYAAPAAQASDVKNIAYIVDNKIFNLKDGKAEQPYAPDGATQSSLVMFGEPVYGDFDVDGDDDAAVLLAYDPGGSGVFYYAALAINVGSEYRATNSMFLGDRIAPQNINVEGSRAVYNYAVRKPGEPMIAQPSIGKSTWIYYDKQTAEIGEWVKDFEGEANVGLREAQARAIAEQTCIKGGESLDSALGAYNENTRTWWFDANLNSVREGCNPACVVDEIAKTAEINWRCTGLRIPE